MRFEGDEIISIWTRDGVGWGEIGQKFLGTVRLTLVYPDVEGVIASTTSSCKTIALLTNVPSL